jgi:hypothetical protein
MLAHFGGAAPPPLGTTFEKVAKTLQSEGYTYDFISDRQVRRLLTNSGRIITEGGASYTTIVLPSSRYVPLETLLQILQVARSGATVVSFDTWPSDVSGLTDLEGRRARFKAAIDAVTFGAADANGTRETALGRGRILQGRDLSRLLTRANVRREAMVDHGLQFARRVDAMGRFYFVSNAGNHAIDEWIPLNCRTDVVMAFDPMSGRQGQVSARTTGAAREVYLQIPAGGALIVAESPGQARERFETFRSEGEAIALPGPWTTRFLKGGPRLPPGRKLDRLVSWTTFGHDAEVFSGTARYTTTFRRPNGNNEAWQLDLGRVAESARLRLNGVEIATLIGPPYGVVLRASQLRATNTLDIAVTNLSANRIRDLDVRGVGWKKFYNVNFPARFPDNRGPDGLFSAAKWQPLESGLLGPVTLTPLAAIR